MGKAFALPAPDTDSVTQACSPSMPEVIPSAEPGVTPENRQDAANLKKKKKRLIILLLFSSQ